MATVDAERNGILAAGFEIGSRSEEIPTIGKLHGSAEVVAGVKCLPRLAALQRQDAIDLPAFEHLRKALLAGERIGERESEAMPDVEIAVPVLSLRIGT